MKKICIVLIIMTLVILKFTIPITAQNNNDYTNDFKYPKELNMFIKEQCYYFYQGNNREIIMVDSKTKKQIIEDIEYNKEDKVSYDKKLQSLKCPKNLSLGQTGEDVYNLKNSLNVLGYKISNMNYYFDVETKNYVVDFQKSNSISADGVVGTITVNKINELLKIRNLTIPELKIEAKEFPTSNYWIAINKSNNTLILFKEKKIQKKYSVATGKKWDYTPEGKFMIVNKRINPTWGGGGYAKPIKGGIPQNPLGYRWMGLDKGGGGTYGIHGTNNPNSIGTYASHGCIRMLNKDVEELFEIVHSNTPVWIGPIEKLESWGIYYNYR